jgi:Txe/YoeB family toxin of Txe-Axe toxin-antitoxin module
MNVKDIDRMARKKIEPDENISILDAGLYYTLRRLYEAYDAKKDEMSPEQAKAEKERLCKAYDDAYTAIKEYDDLVCHNEELMRRIEQHRVIFKQDDKKRVKLSPLIAEANKNGCEICKKIAKVYDGREG